LVTHDIGIMVGFAVAAMHPERVSRWVAIDAPLPGVGPWDQITQEPADNRMFLAQGKLQMPVLALGGEATFGPMIGAVMRCVADNI
jgi:pimeloyl-ACP methyl ester carboxylesterase